MNLHTSLRYRHVCRHLLLHGGHGRIEHWRGRRGHAGPADLLLRHLCLVRMLLELLLVLLKRGLLLRKELLMLRVLRVLGVGRMLRMELLLLQSVLLLLLLLLLL